MRRILLTCLGGLMAGAAALVQAHAHLVSATPADNSRLATAPERLVLSFSEAARLTALWIQKQGGEKQKVSDLPADPARQVSVALPRLAPGAYTVSFRALSADGHVVPGEIHFALVPP